MTRAWLALLTTSGIAACDARTDGDYAGEAMFSLRGTVHNRRAATPEDVKLYLLWAGAQTGNLAVDLHAKNLEFPARFKLDVFEPPDVFGDAPPGSATFAKVVAALPDTDFGGPDDWPLDPATPAAGIVGLDPRTSIYFFTQDVPAGSYMAGYLHQPVRRGFHLVVNRCVGPARQAELTACIAKYPPVPRSFEDTVAILADCGTLWPDSWHEIPAGDLNTEVTVELMDDFTTWAPAPSECIQ